MLEETWRRLQPLIPVLVALGLTVGAMNAAFIALDRTVPRWLPAVVAGGGFLETNYSRVAAAVEETADEVPPSPPVVALLGLSGARECMSVRQLRDANGVPARFVALCGAGGSMEVVATLARPIFELGLVPDLALIGVSPHLLIEPPPPSQVVRATFGERLRRNGWIEIARAGAEWIWFRTRRGDVAGNWGEMTSLARRWFMASMGVPVRTDGIDPWAELWHADWPERAMAASRREMLEGYAARGCFEASKYLEPAAQRQAAALDQLIRELAQQGTEVLVYLVPESSELRDLIPPEGMAALLAAIPIAQIEGVELIDYRDALEDEEFIEHSHANSRGKRRFSQLIAPEIIRRLPATDA